MPTSSVCPGLSEIRKEQIIISLEVGWTEWKPIAEPIAEFQLEH